MSVMFKCHVSDLDSQKAMVGESVQGGAWRPFVLGLGWAVIMVVPSD